MNVKSDYDFFLLKAHLWNSGFWCIHHRCLTNVYISSFVRCEKIVGHHILIRVRQYTHPPTRGWPPAIRRGVHIGWVDGRVQPRAGRDSPPAVGRGNRRVVCRPESPCPKCVPTMNVYCVSCHDTYIMSLWCNPYHIVQVLPQI